MTTDTTDNGLTLVSMIARRKRDKLADVLRRLIANPGNVEQVAEQIAMDWHPTFVVSRDGTTDVQVGTGEFR